MAQARRQVSIFLNGKEVEGTLANVQRELRGLQTQMKNNVVGSEKYEAALRRFNQLNPIVDKHRQNLKGIQKEYESLSSKAVNFLGAAGIAFGAQQIISGLVNVGKEMVTLFDTAAKTDAQLKAALKSTGEVAGRSFEQLNAQAEQLQKFTLFDDDATKAAQARLLTFTKVRTDVFDAAIPLIQDYSTAMTKAGKSTGDLAEDANKVGKALQDPIKGITALSKSGVAFSEVQKQQIKDFVKVGDVASAQRIILEELSVEFGGSAKAAAEAGLGGYQIFQNRIDNIGESIGELIANELNELSPAIDTAISGVEDFVAAEKNSEAATTQFGRTLQSLYNIIGFVGGAFDSFYTAIARTAIFIAKTLNPVFSSLTVGIASVFNIAVDASNKLRELAGFKPLDIKFDIVKFKQNTDEVQKLLENALKTRAVSPEAKKAEGGGGTGGGKSLEVIRAEEDAKQVSKIKQRERERELAAKEKQQEKDKENAAKDKEQKEAQYQAEFDAFAEHLISLNEAELKAEETGQQLQSELREQFRESALELQAAQTEEDIALAQDKYNQLLEAATVYGVDTQAVLDEVAAKNKKTNEDAVTDAEATAEKLAEIQQKRLESVQKTVDTLQEVQGAISAVNEAIIAAGLENTKFGKALAAAQIAISGAVSVAKAVESAISIPFPGNIPAIITAVATVVSTIAKAKKALEGASIPQRKHGGFANVRGSDDGQVYSAKLIGQPSTGLLDYPHPVLTSSGILANEVGKEYYISHTDLRKPAVLDHVRAIENIRTQRQRAEGGFASTSPAANSSPAAAPNFSNLERMVALNNALLAKLLSEGVRAEIGNDELLAMQRMIGKLNKASGGRA
jgi:hypothetical protein